MIRTLYQSYRHSPIKVYCLELQNSVQHILKYILCITSPLKKTLTPNFVCVFILPYSTFCILRKTRYLSRIWNIKRNLIGNYLNIPLLQLHFLQRGQHNRSPTDLSTYHTAKKWQCLLYAVKVRLEILPTKLFMNYMTVFWIWSFVCSVSWVQNLPEQIKRKLFSAIWTEYY